MGDNLFSILSDDVILKILSNLEEDPRNWARLACVSPKFSSLIHTICYKSKCTRTIPSLIADLLSSSSAADPPCGWASLYKLAVCCPGLLHSGVLLENSDFGLERELGPDHHFQVGLPRGTHKVCTFGDTGSSSVNAVPPPPPPTSTWECNDGSWSLYDDLYNDTISNASESHKDMIDNEYNDKNNQESEELPNGVGVVKEVGDVSVVCKRRKVCRSLRSHLASGVWNLSREQGNKLLASRFRGDCLYICDWPGCVHVEEKRNYMLFRGIFKNFKKSRVWRTISDGDRSKIDLKCAFCSCKQTWDLHSAFCLKRVFGYHDDGDPVVRAYVCENGHVSGAWTDWPLYT